MPICDAEGVPLLVIKSRAFADMKAVARGAEDRGCCALLIEMEAIQDAQARVTKTRAKRGSILHHAYVLKDRWRTLNGRTFSFRDLNAYEPGDYEPVFKAF